MERPPEQQTMLDRLALLEWLVGEMQSEIADLKRQQDEQRIEREAAGVSRGLP